jgi:hypothetical protein
MQGGWDTVVGLNVAMAARLYCECTEARLMGIAHDRHRL